VTAQVGRTRQTKSHRQAVAKFRSNGRIRPEGQVGLAPGVAFSTKTDMPLKGRGREPRPPSLARRRVSEMPS
jgi:hypothetical protein